MKKIAVVLYPNFSIQEISVLTSCLTVWFGETLDFVGSEITPYRSEDGFLVTPTKRVSDVSISDYDCVILPGIIDPLPALFDEKIVSFLRGAKKDTIIAAISSAPLLLAKAGLLDRTRFTAGFFMQMAQSFPFIPVGNMVHQPVVEDGNVITAIGFAFREFAAAVLARLGYDAGEKLMWPVDRDYTEEELTFYWEKADYQEFLEELKGYQSTNGSV